METSDHIFKILIIGDSNVGKSCLMLRYADNSFTDTHISTIGVDFKEHVLKIDNQTIKLQLWDTAGQERFKTITSSYYRGSEGIMIVYDITDKTSFESINQWMGEVNEYGKGALVKLLIGNKCDLEDQRVIQKTEIEKVARELGVSYMETSAKSNTNVDQSFEFLAKEILKLRSPNNKKNSSTVELATPKIKKTGLCYLL
eukprot:TRINITY_DN262_c0_g1_i1.p1 TRINITY_DN262_c0_g1~~TRINITY_DN262_c0_g1_i1.p1  ORF type:complete len:200 (+),score=49.40 TRINITY_DN262_c0_g1_i1:31-630(+)